MSLSQLDPPETDLDRRVLRPSRLNVRHELPAPGGEGDAFRLAYRPARFHRAFDHSRRRSVGSLHRLDRFRLVRRGGLVHVWSRRPIPYGRTMGVGSVGLPHTDGMNSQPVTGRAPRGRPRRRSRAPARPWGRRGRLAQRPSPASPPRGWQRSRPRVAPAARACATTCWNEAGRPIEGDGRRQAHECRRPIVDDRRRG